MRSTTTSRCRWFQRPAGAQHSPSLFERWRRRSSVHVVATVKRLVRVRLSHGVAKISPCFTQHSQNPAMPREVMRFRSGRFHFRIAADYLVSTSFGGDALWGLCSVLGPLKRPLCRLATFVTDERHLIEIRGKNDRHYLHQPHARLADGTVRRSQDKVQAYFRWGRHLIRHWK